MSNPQGENQYTKGARHFKSGAGMTSSVKKRRVFVVTTKLFMSNGTIGAFKGKTFRDQSVRRAKLENLLSLRKRK